MPDELVAQRLDTDLKTCLHRHNVLAVGVETDVEFPVPMMLYHWSPPPVYTIMRRVVSPRLSTMSRGFTPLGIFYLGDYFDLSETFTELLTKQGGNPESTPQGVADLGGEVVEPTQGAFIQSFSVVFGNNPSRVLDDGRF